MIKKKIAVLTYGCSNNMHEGELMEGILEQHGYSITDEDDADLVVVNMCTVKNPTENKIVKKIGILSKKSKPLVIGGCIPKELLPELKRIAPKASFINTHNLIQINKAVDRTLAGESIDLLERKNTVKLCMPKRRKNTIISIIPICSGCNGKCSYCSVRLIKGKLFSYPQTKIVEEAERSLKEGCKELWITSQDNAAYEYGLITLLKRLVALPYDFRIRIGMMDPNNVLGILKPLIKMYQHEKIFKFLHIPVQAGNDQILRKMKRQYSVDDFREIVHKFREAIPDITISTDVICGFPGENEKQFEDTINLIKELKPAVLNISRFWPRPGTTAASMKQLHGNITKLRSQQMTKAFNDIALQSNRKWIGWKGMAIVDELGKDNTFIARNDFYKPIILTGKHHIGQKVNVVIKSATRVDLRT